MKPDLTPRTFAARQKILALGDRPRMVGILNVTPDSFFDGGRNCTTDTAFARGCQLEAEGAAVIDIGGESTRPGHTPVAAEAEAARVVPVIARLAAQVRIPLSIDTHKVSVARAAIAAGADIINDVRGFQGDPELPHVAAQSGCGVILMHNDPALLESRGRTVERVADFFARSLVIATRAGVSQGRIILDPGIGFAKTHEQNLELLGRIGELRSLGCPLLLGASRKSVIGNVLSLTPDERLEGTLATTALAAWQGVEFLRVHDVRANLRAALMARAIRDAVPISS